MTSHQKRLLCFLCVFCASVVNCFCLDREAFSVANYDLNLQVEPEQHRLGVRGKITLRNDTSTPQKIAVLQISSSLDWRSIKAGDKPLQFVTQPYTSDIDHTGSLSEAIVTLPQAVAPKGTIELEIGYEGVVVLDATRLTRIGIPEDAADNTDWDQIDSKFTALRGAGYVTWYPIATEVANLSDGNSLSAVLGRWKTREAESTMKIQPAVTMDYPSTPQILLGGLICPVSKLEATSQVNQYEFSECAPRRIGFDIPVLLIGAYEVVEQQGLEIRYLPGHNSAAAAFAESAKAPFRVISEWFGTPRERVNVADLPDQDASPFESGVLLVTPLANSTRDSPGLAAAHQFTHASFLSFRPWIEEGLAHFAQALYLEQQGGRKAALDYMGRHRATLGQIENPEASPSADNESNHSLVNTTSEELYRSKAMYVWWMLRDMVGDAALKKALAAYRPEQDNDPSYMPKLIAAQTHRDLQWFFDDWIYHDHGLAGFQDSVGVLAEDRGEHLYGDRDGG